MRHSNGQWKIFQRQAQFAKSELQEYELKKKPNKLKRNLCSLSDYYFLCPLAVAAPRFAYGMRRHVECNNSKNSWFYVIFAHMSLRAVASAPIQHEVHNWTLIMHSPRVPVAHTRSYIHICISFFHQIPNELDALLIFSSPRPFCVRFVWSLAIRIPSK